MLENIKNPNDLKKLEIEQLSLLSNEIRQVLIDKLSNHGGHIGPNLAMVEITIALHYVFNSPYDKFVFDVSHQSYVHKILTGRSEAFTDESKYDNVSGYTNPSESEHDLFEIGHTSTSLSLACGLAKGRDLQNENYNVVALIGDGSLSGGEAYEGLNNIIENNSNTIVILNDNQMSITENHGGIYKNLQKLRETKGECENNVFTAIGFDYYFIEDGHDLNSLIEIFKKVKNCKKPVLIHICTIKGKGLNFAEHDKEKWHWNFPFDKNTGESKINLDIDYNELTGQYISEKLKSNSNLVAVTSATPSVFAFNKDRREQAGKQFVDVGICEEHAIAFISGIAKAGAKPIYPVYSSFLQRTYDQLSQDLALNKNPAVIIVFAGSVYGLNDVTHLGLFDISLLNSIPNIVTLAPTCKEEYFDMLEYSLKETSFPIIIRVPGGKVLSNPNYKCTGDYSNINKFKVEKEGSKIALIGVGTFFNLCEEIANELETNYKIKPTLINPQFISGIDKDLLRDLQKNHSLLITIEDGIIDGGFGQNIASFLGMSNVKVKNYGIPKSFPDRFIAENLLEENGISKKQIIDFIIKNLQIKND